MKKVYLILALLCFPIICTAQKMDLDFKIYLPTALGFVTGNNPYLGLRENVDEVDSCTNFMVETRGSIVSVNKFTFSWSFGMGAYIENNKNHDTDLFSLNLSTGCGVYYHPFKSETFPLNGFCCYLYPAYQIPVYTQNFKPFLDWKTGVDIGYNLTILNTITIYPYLRNMFAWNSTDFRYGFDCGIAVGIYFHDNSTTVR